MSSDPEVEPSASEKGAENASSAPAPAPANDKVNVESAPDGAKTEAEATPADHSTNAAEAPTQDKTNEPATSDKKAEAEPSSKESKAADPAPAEKKASPAPAESKTAEPAAAKVNISEDELSIREWLGSLFSDPRFTAVDPRVSLQTLLGDGVLVCQLANKVKKGTIARINPSNALRFMLVVCFFSPIFTFSFLCSFFKSDHMVLVSLCLCRRTFATIVRHAEHLAFRLLLCLNRNS